MFGAELVEHMADADVAAWGAVLAAPFIGSFLGVVVQRLPDGRPIALARSRCEECGAALAVRDLVPLFSWLASGGRCRFCRHPLGWFYPVVELAALAVALISVWVDSGAGAWLDCVVGGGVVPVRWVDL